jgi:hypothetical protein
MRRLRSDPGGNPAKVCIDELKVTTAFALIIERKGALFDLWPLFTDVVSNKKIDWVST